MGNKPEKTSLPKGWDEAALKAAADQIKRWIDAYERDGKVAKKFTRYEFAQDVFDDQRVPSNLIIIRDAEPKNYPLLRTQVKGAIRTVASAFDGANPYYVLTGEGDAEIRENREHDTQLALEADGYTDKLRETARFAAIYTRGPFRVTWEEQVRGKGWLNVDELSDSDIEFAGPKRELIHPEDFGLYPPNTRFLTEARGIWHRFWRPMHEIWSLQEDGYYLPENIVEIKAEHEQDVNVDEVEDYQPNIYTGIFKLARVKGEAPVAYRVSLLYSQSAIIRIEPYNLPMPEYFAPGFEYDPLDFWATHGIATSVLQMQAEVNDANFTRLIGAVAAFKRTILVSGYVGEMMTEPTMLGDLVTFRGDPKFTVVQTSENPGGELGALAEEAKRYAEGVTGFSDVAAGQLPEASQTATATGGALQGVADEGAEKRQNFLSEEARAVEFMQILIQRNFNSFKKFHGDKLKTKKASDWRGRYQIGANGQGPNNNPQATIDKLTAMMDVFTQMGVPFVEDVLLGKAENVGVAISRVELAKAVEQNLDLSMTTEKIIVDTRDLPPIEPPAPPPSPLDGFAPDPSLLAGGGIPPELLGLIGGGGPGGIPAPPPMLPPVDQLGSLGIDPMLIQQIAGGAVPY